MVGIDVFTKQAVIHVSNTCTSTAGKIAYQKVVSRFGKQAVYVNDNGSENQDEAENWLKSEGITQLWARPRTPKDKPCVERMIETLQVECFGNESISKKWKEYWPSSGNSQNWDGIFKINDTWYFVEAKAHESELNSSCGATSDSSIEKIKKAFDETVALVKATKNSEYWLSKDFKSYQLANRLAFINFCSKNGINAKLVYISFINGYDKPGASEKLNVTSKEKWQEIWENEYADLGISAENIKEILHHVYIDCNSTSLNF